MVILAQWFYSESGSKFKQAWSAPTGIIELARYDSVSSTELNLVSFSWLTDQIFYRVNCLRLFKCPGCRRNVMLNR